jgi:glycerophosphoryl diester phosphodiesterase
MKIIGHRGAAGIALENTKTSIEAALSHGVDAIEIDVRLTKDGELVLCHDASFDRVSEDSRAISDLTVAQVRKITLNNGEHPLTLTEAWKLVGKTQLVIECKGSGWHKALLQFVKLHKPSNISVISFHVDELAEFAISCPQVECLVLENTNPIGALHFAKQHGLAGIDINYRVLHPLVYWLAKIRKLEVWVYTVNRPWHARFLRLFFHDIRITTDRPDQLHFLTKTESKADV